MSAMTLALADLRFDNRFARALPADPITENFRRQVPKACYSRVRPTPAPAPRLAGWAPEVAELLDLPADPTDRDRLAEVFAGNRLLDGMVPIATRYGGHQFGSWAGQLGDGRAINLGEIVNRRGEHWTLQLKGAGPTPYSRGADGFAVLRSSLREFVCSEAMFHLGVPTTRALSLVVTGEDVTRDILYDGHPAPEPGAVVCRAAPSFTRFGHFEIFAAHQETALLRRFADFTIATEFPHLTASDRTDGAIEAGGTGNARGQTRSRYAAWFREVCERTAEMVAQWMRVGFVHGVMNTDNMSILGLTIDYGPYGWLEGYDPHWTPNTTDAATRRYSFGQQPAVAQWNLLQLANAIYPLLGDPEPLNEALAHFASHYQRRSQALNAAKLGLAEYLPERDNDLFRDLFALLSAAETDMTVFFRRLAQVDLTNATIEPLLAAYYQPVTPAVRERAESWLARYAARAQVDGRPDVARVARMNAANPLFVPRNYLAQQAIDKAEEGDYNALRELMGVLRNPYEEQPDKASFAEKRPEWARCRRGCSMLSCSS